MVVTSLSLISTPFGWRIMQIKIKQKLLFISATSLVVLALVTTNLLFSMRNSMLDDKRPLVKSAVQTAYGTLQHYHELIVGNRRHNEQIERTVAPEDRERHDGQASLFENIKRRTVTAMII